PPEVWRGLLVLAGLTLAAAGCGHAGTSSTAPARPSAGSPPSPAAANPAATAAPNAAEALCRPAESGALKARLQGAIEAEIDWHAPAVPQCIGGPRPGGDGLRLVYKGQAGTQPLLVIIGVALRSGDRAARNVPANITLVPEGSGRFFATQGDDKCFLDAVTQEPVAGHDGQYRLRGRGYCTQPARAVGTVEGAVVVARFDVDALVDYPKETPTP
ncbi:MAG: hypothetical protein ACR2I8_03790, partial [Steroidobacteraceae bacterium]